MTSSCFGSCLALGPTCGPVARFLGLGEASWAREWHFVDSPTWVDEPRGRPGRPTWVGVPPGIVHFCPKNGIFGVETSIILGFWAFFDLGTSLAEPDLLKTGPKLNLVAGGSLEVIESTSFPSPTGPQEVPRTPGDLPAGLPRSFGNTCIFFNFWWRHLWVTCNLLALSRSRFAGAGEGSQCLMVS